MSDIELIKFSTDNKSFRTNTKNLFYDDSAYVYFWYMLDFIKSRKFTIDEYKKYKEVIELKGSSKSVFDNTITAKDYLLDILKSQIDYTLTVKQPIILPKPEKVINPITENIIVTQDKVNKTIDDIKKTIYNISSSGSNFIKNTLFISSIIVILYFIFIKKEK